MIRIILRITSTALAQDSATASTTWHAVHVGKQNSRLSEIEDLIQEASIQLGYPGLDRERDLEIITLPSALCPLPFTLCPLPFVLEFVI